MPGTTSLVLFDTSGSVQWFDWQAMNTVDEVDLDFGFGGSRGYSLTPIFTPDSATLYGMRGDVLSFKAVDTAQRSVTATNSLVAESTPPLRGSLGLGSQAAAMTPDASRVLAVDIRRGGIRVIGVPQLSFDDWWLPGQAFTRLSVTPDGQTIYATSGESGILCILGSDGSVRNTITTGLHLADFI